MKDYYLYTKTYLINDDEGFLTYKVDLYMCSYQTFYTLLSSKEFNVSANYLESVGHDIADIVNDCQSELITETFRKMKADCKRDKLTKKQIKKDCTVGNFLDMVTAIDLYAHYELKGVAWCDDPDYEAVIDYFEELGYELDTDGEFFTKLSRRYSEEVS